MVNCNKCKTKNIENAKFCKECGNPLKNKDDEIHTIVCIKCEHLNPVDTKFCEQCGEKIIINEETKLKSILVSAILEDHAWVEEAMENINDGLESGTSKSEIKEIYLEAEKRKNKLLKLLKNSLNKTTDKSLLKLIKDRIKDNEGELKAIKEQMDSGEDNSFACPYCKREINVKDGIHDNEMEIECELCHKKFVTITGIVSVTRGRMNAAVQYGPEQISITLKLNGGKRTINFRTRYRFLVHKGDRISFIYQKKLFSSSYKEDPSFIFNWSAEDVFMV